MRQLAQPHVLKSAALAALITSLVCFPRLALRQVPYPIWYLESVTFVGSFVLWAFVFAWHTRFTHRPVFHHRIELRLWAITTAAGIVVALVLHRFLDPILRLRTPADYPASVDEWLVTTAFALAFNPLFLTFAPLAWAIRLVNRLRLAVGFTVLFGIFVLLVKVQSAPTPLPPMVFMELLALRLVMGSFSVYFYLQGGAALTWWWALLLQLRHLLTL